MTKKILFKKCREEAVVPTKNNESDTGYDLTLLGVEKQVGNVILCRTGIKAKPPEGYYLDVVPRSSIIKTGYMLANSVGIIDQDYRGEIFAPLVKIDPQAPDIEFPIRLCQLIPRKFHHFETEVVEELDETIRNEKGFGSSGHV